jgi:transcriptional regulator with XRE-family HTH domain
VKPTCRALTADGKPCRNHCLNSDGLCWRHDGRPKPEYRPRIKSNAPKTCIVCGHERPTRAFGSGPSNPKTGVAYRRRTCLDCEERKRRAAGIPKRHRRYDARGNVWCNNCKRYLSRENFKRHPQRPHTFWSYCKECTRALDRLRARNIRGTEQWEQNTRRRVSQKRQQRSQEHAERQRFVQDAITLLRRRGLTKAEICRVADVSFGSLLAWERGERRILPNVAARFGDLLLTTADWLLAEEATYRRRLPHPRLPELFERMAPRIEQLPVRSRWKQAA